MKRKDKALSVTRYLTGHTGIPLLRWNGVSIDAPQPYSIELTTGRQWWRFGEMLRETANKSGIPIVIRYDGYIDGVENAIVGTTLKAFTELLKLHHENGETHGTTSSDR